ncbi:MAG: glycosyltransferase [Ferruginibacter sp.]|nr:glycosyltransferase [Ferruginibacter sp.]
MIRICTSLANAGYSVTLTGVQKATSPPLSREKYDQKRLNCFFKSGPGFYAEYNTRLFFYLLFRKADIICCIDLDSMLPVWLVCKLRNKKAVYDAHEYFSQQKEIMTRPRVYRVWKWIERTFVPKFKNGYTVSQGIAEEFKERYAVNYDVIRNVPVLRPFLPGMQEKPGTILYQGAVNEARGLEFLVPAMKLVDARLEIYGDGNFMEQTKKLIAENNLQDKVFLKGKLLPGELDNITRQACIGINLVENTGLNQYYSLANKFFDYIHNALPQVTMNYPEYKKINEEFEVAILVNDLDVATIAGAINRLLNDEPLRRQLKQNCLKARELINWQNEEKKLTGFYNKLN